MTLFGSFFDEMAAPALQEALGEAVTVTTLAGATLSFTAMSIVRREQLDARQYPDGLLRVRQASMTCSIADYPAPVEGDVVAIATYPGSGATVQMKVTGEPNIIPNTQQTINLVRIEVREKHGSEGARIKR